MLDRLGREIDYIRISVTDRCNLRCVYCMPPGGVPLVGHEELLTFEEILKVCECCKGLGIRAVKITGGEPLARRGVVELIGRIKEIPGIEKVTITTNGMLLKKFMKELGQLGIDGINISLDTLNPRLYRQITGYDGLGEVMSGIEEAMRYPLVPLKINCVPLGISGQEIFKVAGLAEAHPVHVRFIEMMPIGLGKQFAFRSEEELLEELEAHYGKAVPWKEKLGNGPSHYYSLEGFQGKIGFISALSHGFCSGCNRLRLTSCGYLKACLQYDGGRDLRAILRDGGPQDRLEQAIRDTILHKPLGHHFHSEPDRNDETACMYQIGG